jgi:MFS family permease
MLINMLGTPFMSLQAAICSEFLHQGPAFISVMNAAYLAGSVGGSVLSPVLRKKVKNSTLFLLMMLLVGAAYFTLVGTSHFTEQPLILYLMIILLLFAVGFASGVLNVMLSVLMMEMTEQSYLSRVSAVVSSAMMAGQLAAAGVISAVLARIDLYRLFIAVSIASFVLCAVFLVNPATRDVDMKVPKKSE